MAFCPDISLWTRWIKGFDTYVIYNNNIKVGIISLNIIHCIIATTGNEGRIATPIICNGDMKSVIPVLVNIVDIKEYDVLYFHQYGDVKTKHLESINCIKTDHTMWFSLYNNKIKIKPSDISVPFL